MNYLCIIAISSISHQFYGNICMDIRDELFVLLLFLVYLISSMVTSIGY